ncbi:MAG: branched-chain amino acid ABC transporter permease [Pseudotabrizicola sp.]|uniref:branched-chain amino acid ABC transporter permease n=2 Tax=Pseudotabrizicola sp. TaxID=2939647 RepID=UPI0027319284|nr:branched-chain amino acid ABC transporter permease [Pseudotabrizicola sp.]MDP2081221.1 branched-chain amino acid ABC transporter permease [Pseudotabrizicola sp.]MDZ7576160.1 branched-chain amino acid ABC transporter permease [Pseudotabrizicola sp.]
MTQGAKIWGLHLLILVVVFAAQFVLPSYHMTNLARIMVLAVFAMGYNIAFGYTGLLSLGHALFFAAGFYAMGLPIWHLGWLPLPALIAGLMVGGLLAGAVGLLALRTAGVSFMIVTLMFAQAGYLTLLYLNTWTGGDEGFVVARTARVLGGLDLATDTPRFMAAFALFACAMLVCLWLVRSPLGRVMVAMRENEERSRMLGYDPFRIKLIALIVSGVYAGAAGAAYGMLFGYVGATFATIQYSILPMLYVLLGGAGTVLGPFLGALLMFYLIDITSGYTDAYLFVVGAALVGLVLFAPKGILGTLRERIAPWLP